MSPEENKHRRREDDMAAVDPRSLELAGALQEKSEHLTNGSKGDLKKMSEGIAVMLDSQKHMQEKVDQLPTRPEVREMIISHAQTCALARGDNAAGITIGKSGFKATGRVALWSVVAIVVLAAVVGPYAAEVVSAWRGVKAAAAKAERAAAVAETSQASAQMDRDALMAMMKEVLVQVKAEETNEDHR